MKRLVVVTVIAVLTLSGCVSGKFLGFLATADYVDEQVKATADKQAAEIDQLKAQLADLESLREQAQAAVEQVDKSQKAIEDLQAGAQSLEERIVSLPRDVLKQIIDILQAALQQ